jgi:hypothetical protein
MGPKFTWVSHRTDGTLIRERLDQAVAHHQYCGLHKQAVVNVLATCSSDHNPILLKINNMQEGRARYQRGFKVEASWMIDEEYNDVDRKAWEEGNQVTQTSTRLD